MKPVSIKNRGLYAAEFTLVELMFALSLGAVLMAFAYPAIIHAMFQVKASGWQTHFIGEARLAQQKINQTVQNHKYMNIIDDETVEIYSAEGNKSTLFYDPSGDLKNRTISLTADGDTRILCRHVSPIEESEPIFQMTTSENPSRQHLHVAFHVGDPPTGNPEDDTTGPGYQGLEMRFTTSPRNLQQWHDFN